MQDTGTLYFQQNNKTQNSHLWRNPNQICGTLENVIRYTCIRNWSVNVIINFGHWSWRAYVWQSVMDTAWLYWEFYHGFKVTWLSKCSSFRKSVNLFFKMTLVCSIMGLNKSTCTLPSCLQSRCSILSPLLILEIQ